MVEVMMRMKNQRCLRKTQEKDLQHILYLNPHLRNLPKNPSKIRNLKGTASSTFNELEKSDFERYNGSPCISFTIYGKFWCITPILRPRLHLTWCCQLGVIPSVPHLVLFCPCRNHRLILRQFRFVSGLLSSGEPHVIFEREDEPETWYILVNRFRENVVGEKNS